MALTSPRWQQVIYDFSLLPAGDPQRCVSVMSITDHYEQGRYVTAGREEIKRRNADWG